MRLIHKNEKGMVLPLGLMFLAIIAITGTTAVIVTTTDLKIGSNYRQSVQAFYIAEAGLARAEAELINDLNNDQDFSNGSYVTTSGTIALAYDDSKFNNLFNDIPFGEGFYTIQLKNYPGFQQPDRRLPKHQCWHGFRSCRCN
jgi:Tfp pilus assembly protein PilX